MDRFSGNTSSNATSSTYQSPMVIDNFLLVNKTGGAVTVNVYRIGGQDISIAPLNKSLAMGEVYQSDRATLMLATEAIKVEVSGSVDYDFTLSNTLAPIPNPID